MSFTRPTNLARRSRYFCLIFAERLCFGGSVCWALAAGRAIVNATATATTEMIFFMISPKSPAASNRDLSGAAIHSAILVGAANVKILSAIFVGAANVYSPPGNGRRLIWACRGRGRGPAPGAAGGRGRERGS